MPRRDAHEVLTELRRGGLVFELKGNQVSCSTPRGQAVTGGVRGLIRAHHDDMRAILRAEQGLDRERMLVYRRAYQAGFYGS